MLRSVTSGVLLLSVLSCTTVQQVRAPGDYVPEEPPAVLWVTNEHDEAIPLGNPRLVGDSLVGTWIGVGEPVVIRLDASADVRRIDGMRTALLGLGLTSGTLLLLMLAGGGGGTGDGASMDAMMCNDMEMMGDCM